MNDETTRVREIVKQLMTTELERQEAEKKLADLIHSEQHYRVQLYLALQSFAQNSPSAKKGAKIP
jgi:uncharacterized membrane protein YheB (UPF0754 family)